MQSRLIVWIFKNRMRLGPVLVIQSIPAFILSLFHGRIISNVTLIYGIYAGMCLLIVGLMFKSGLTVIHCSINYLDISPDAPVDSDNKWFVAYMILAFYFLITAIILMSGWAMFVAVCAGQAGVMSQDFNIPESFLLRRKSGKLLFRLRKLNSRQIELSKQLLQIYGQKYVVKESPDRDIA